MLILERLKQDASYTQVLEAMDKACNLAKMVLLKIQEAESFHVEVDFFGKDTVQDMIDFIVRCVFSSSDVYAKCVSIVGKILFVQPKDTFTQPGLNMIVGLLTMCWMSGEVKFGDLRLGEAVAKNLIKSGEIAQPVKECVDLFVSISKEVAPKWRLNVIRKIIGTDSDRQLHVAVVNNFPMLAHTFGALSYPLIKEIISQVLEIESDKILAPALAAQAGRIVCAFTKKTKLQRIGGVELILCPFCDEGRFLVSRDSLNDEAPTTIEANDLEILLKLIGHHEKSVSTNVLSMLKPMSNHIGFNITTASLWMHYLDTSEEKDSLLFSASIKYLITPAWLIKSESGKSAEEVTRHDKEYFDLILDRLREATQRAMSVESILYQDAVCRCLKSIADLDVKIKIVDESVLDMLLDLLFSKKAHVTVFCVCEDLLRDKIMSHKLTFSTKLAIKMCDGNPKAVLDFVMALFKGVTLQKFVEKHLNYLMPQLVLQSARLGPPGPQSPIEFLSFQLGTKSKHLVADNFQHIFPHMVTASQNTNEYHKCTKYLEAITKVEVKQLIQSNRQKIVTELLVHFHKYTRRVETAFSFLAKHDDEFKIAKGDKISKADIARYILPRFWGILGYFDQRLNKKGVDVEKKIDMLASLQDIIKFMGSEHVASVKHKVLSTLCTALTNLKSVENHDVSALLCSTWESFITTIDVAYLKPILGQIIASLLQLLDRAPDRVVKMIHNLVIKNKNHLQDTFPKLNFLPEIPALQQINDTIRTESGLAPKNEFRSVIRYTTNSLSNENTEVRAQTLTRLLQLLHLNTARLQELVVNSDEADPVISYLVLILLGATRTNSESVASMAGSCLGKIGAVDPGRLHLVEDLNQSSNAICLNIMEEEFINDLVNNLVKAYLSSTDSADADACSFSIQEVLKAYSIKEGGKLTTVSGRVWNGLSDATQEILKPLLVSLYSRTDNPVTYSVPVYKSQGRQKLETLPSHDFLIQFLSRRPYLSRVD